MFSQFFGNYLVENQKITAEQFSACMTYIKANRVKLGLIAESEGLLTSSQVMELNYLQVQSDERFGDLAVKKGYLTESDVNYLLGLQSNPYLLFVQALDENGCLTNDEIDYNLTAFQKENDFSNSIMKAIRDGNIEGMLPAFVDVKDKRYLDLIGLTLRNVIRFISSYVRIAPGCFVSDKVPKYAAYQKIIGDYELTLGFTGENDDILALADGYAKEEFPTVDEDALDSIAEFTNCVNGLYAAELSFQSISLDMMPPQLSFDKKIDVTGEYYSLPIYLEGKESHIIVQFN
ncbi:MAG: chemotaxis protein CheX [Eubacterium sp.]|nr:chemotaxis protein CheX [Eubacterium sp.]